MPLDKEAIKNALYHVKFGIYPITAYADIEKWLRELLEENERLQAECESWKAEALLQGRLYLEKQERAFQAEREQDAYRKALEWYADNEWHDTGDRARNILSQYKGNESLADQLATRPDVQTRKAHDEKLRGIFEELGGDSNGRNETKCGR